jgi:Kef-type K+ transport system membrane component KefB
MARYREGTGTGLFVAIGSLTIYSILAWLIAFLFWLAFCIYAVVEWIGDGRPSAIALSLILVLLIGGLVTLAAVGVNFVGKSLTPSKRERE